MAIQIPNAGTGNGASGDNEFVLWTKVINNFSDQTNAASRIVGTGGGQVSLNDDLFKSLQGAPVNWRTIQSGGDANTLEAGDRAYLVTSVVNAPIGSGAVVETFARYQSSRKYQICYSGVASSLNINFYYRIGGEDGTWSEWLKIYSTGNTTIVNGSLKPSSPVVKIHTDSLELNGDAERMGVTLNKRGVGDYLLQNTTGLRNDGGWRIELPQDVNGNPYFAVAYNELENNDIEVKTYKRIFDMNTFMFVPDLENPVDIKEGRSIAIRFNDLPQDDLDDIQTEV